jgi:4a-hydroxytetrahydrobiopterin dehydratase
MATLSDAEIQARLAQLDRWSAADGSIERKWKLEDFAAAIAFVNRVADVAEQANHHPDILLHGWNKVRLTLSTHSEGGSRSADFALAKRSTAPLSRTVQASDALATVGPVAIAMNDEAILPRSSVAARPPGCDWRAWSPGPPRGPPGVNGPLTLTALLTHQRVLASPSTQWCARRSRLVMRTEGARGAPGARPSRNVSDHISAVQIGITMTSIGIGALGEPALARLLEEALGDDAQPRRRDHDLAAVAFT